MEEFKNTLDTRLEEALRQAESELLLTSVAQAAFASANDGLSFSNIVGVGVSERTVRNQPTGEKAVAIYVAHKRSLDAVEPQAVVPNSYEGVPTDVIETGEFVASSARHRHRPTPWGVSIGHATGQTGTLGFLAKRGNESFVVSNNHVLACENQASKGDAILQPGVADGGGAEDKLGELADWVRLDFDGGHNPVDAAIAAVEDGTVASSLYGGDPLIQIPKKARLNAVVRKCGRTSGVSHGVVFDTSATIKLRYSEGFALLSDQMLIRGIDGAVFSEPGDSGSLVVDEESQQPIGLVCGGSPVATLANQIHLVLDGLGVSLCSQ